MTAEFTVAVHALVYLHHRGGWLSSEELAQNVCTNPARIRKIMAKLKKAGLVQAHEGRVKGGYACVQRAPDISLDEVFAAVDDKVVKSAWRSGGPEMPCLIASGMAAVMDGLYDELDALCRQKLAQVTLGDVEKRLCLAGREDG